MPINLDDKIANLDPARQQKVQQRADELISEEKNRQAEALVVFTNVMSVAGPRVRASLFFEGKKKAATSTLTEAGFAKLRAWARRLVGDAKLAEMVNVSGQGVFQTSLEEKMLSEQTIALEPNDAMARKLAHASFPEYTGRKFKVQVVVEGTSIDVTSYWDGGSRDYFVVLNLATMKSVPVPQNGDPYTKRIAPVKIHENMCVVQHSIFMGKDSGLTFIISEKNAAQLLPAKDDNLDKKEKVVLVLLRSLKPAYRRDEARQAGISATEYDQIVANLKVKQYVNPTGAITAKGKNAISDIRDLYQLRNESTKPRRRKAVKEESGFCDTCDRVHQEGETCPGSVLAKPSDINQPVQESVLTEETHLLKRVKSDKVFAEYTAYLALTGYKLLRYGPNSADWNINRVGDLYIKGHKWEIDGHIKGTRINPTGDSLESLDAFLDQNNI